jgi:hypothetical protein
MSESSSEYVEYDATPAPAPCPLLESCRRKKHADHARISAWEYDSDFSEQPAKTDMPRMTRITRRQLKEICRTLDHVQGADRPSVFDKK